MSYIGNTPGVSSQRVVLEEVVTGSPKSAFVPQSGYIIGYVDVLVNGVEIDSTDFSAPDGVTVTLATAAAVGDTVKVKTWLPRGLSDGYLKSEADARFLKLDGTNAVLGGGSFSGWGATHKALQFGALGAVSSDPGWTRIWQNVYSDGTNYRYTANGGAGLLLMGYQGMYAYTAASGNAGNVATMNNILGLDLSGNLSLTGKLSLAGAGSVTGAKLVARAGGLAATTTTDENSGCIVFATRSISSTNMVIAQATNVNVNTMITAKVQYINIYDWSNSTIFHHGERMAAIRSSSGGNTTAASFSLGSQNSGSTSATEPATFAWTGTTTLNLNLAGGSSNEGMAIVTIAWRSCTMSISPVAA